MIRSSLRKVAAGFSAVIFTAAALSACVSVVVSTQPPLPSDTPALPTQTASPTATVIWFPATPTPTPYPTRALTPTPDLRPTMGAEIFSDAFTNGAAWKLSSTENGNIALGKKEITIAIQQPKAYLYTIRDGPALSDFYAEITASPTLCKGDDEYGLIFRASGPANYFRFSVSCDGQTRLDRVMAGEASSPQPWTLSGAIPPGAPNTNRLAVWASGPDLRLYVNDQFQFSIRDPSLPGGSLGIFARSAGDTAVTVSFSNLVVYKVR